jgi:hypothetical protein
MRRNFKDYNKQELFDKIEQISIEQVENQIITKYGSSVLSIANVSNRYEIFDIKSYLKSKIDVIENNFNITKYFFRVHKGIQELTLLSDSIEIEGVNFYKSFFILNSSDKSRRLSFNAGLYSDDKNFYVVSSIKNLGLTKKHLKGVTEAAEMASEGLNGETFNEQIESLQNLVGHRISLSKLKESIVVDSEIKAEHMKFDAFKNAIIYYSSEGRLKLSSSQYVTLKTPSEKLEINNNNDFYVDAFWAFQTYMRLFNKQDSHVVKRETERIMSITQWAIRNQALEQLGIF